MVYHQNIRGLKDKVQAFTPIFPEIPHILCLTEHHIKKNEIDMISIEIYNVGAKFCR